MRITGRTSLLALVDTRKADLGLSDAEICRRAGISPNAIYNVRMYPKRLFNLTTALALIEALECSLEATALTPSACAE